MVPTFDVFLCHSARDEPVVRPLAERLRADGLRVWFDDDPAKVEEGLENSRTLVLCLSANAGGAEWARLESETLRFRDPLNRERRFVLLRLDDAAVPGSLGQLPCIRLARGGISETRSRPAGLRSVQRPGRAGGENPLPRAH